MDRQTDSPPPLFTKREKYALALLTLSFIVASALVHVLIGSVGSGLFPHFQPEAAASIEPVIIEALTSPTPTPTPPPVPTPRVPATAMPHERAANPPQPRPPVHPLHPSANSTITPSRDSFPTERPIVSSPSASPIVTPSAGPPAMPAPQQITDSEFIRKTTPEYPQLAIDENIQGSVTVRITVGPDGRVEEAVIVQSSGSPILDDAALKATYDSAFRAPLADGKPTTRQYLIIYTFSLDDPPDTAD